MVQLAFGRHTTLGLIHISQADRGIRCACTCPECGEALVAKKREKSHHFAHRSSRESGHSVDCAGTGQMTALHRFARDLFLKGGVVTLPSAGFNGAIVIHDVEELVKTPKSEHQIAGIQADICFSRSGRPCVIEISVTHSIDGPKAAKIRRQQLEAFEIKLDRLLDSKPLDMSIEHFVRHKAPREWVYNSSFEAEKQRALTCYSVPERSKILSAGAEQYARLYDESLRRSKSPAPSSISSRKAAIAQYLKDPNKGFEGFFSAEPEDWRAFILLDCLGSQPSPLQQILTRLRRNRFLDATLAGIPVEIDDAYAAGLPSLKAEACVFSYLDWLERGGVVVSLPIGWCRLIDIPDHKPGIVLHVAPKLTQREKTGKRRDEVQAILDRIAAHLSIDEKREFDQGINIWWSERQRGLGSPSDIVQKGNIFRLKEQLTRVEVALASKRQVVLDWLGLPLSLVKFRLQEEEKARGPERREELSAKAIAQLGSKLGGIWLETNDFKLNGETPISAAVGSDQGMSQALKRLTERSVLFVDRYQGLLKDWAVREYGHDRFVTLHHTKLRPPSSPLMRCYDAVSFEEMKIFVTQNYPQKGRR